MQLVFFVQPYSRASSVLGGGCVTSPEVTPTQLPVILVKKLLHSSFSQSVKFALSVVLTLCFISVDLPDVYHW